MKILCICPIGIGNYLLTYPACSLLKKRRPEADLHLLALRRSIRDLAGDDPLWSKIHCMDPTHEVSLASQVRLISELTSEHFDASLGFFPANNWQSNLLPFVSGVKKRYAFAYPLKKGPSLSFLNSVLTPIDPEAHDVRQNLRLIAAYTGSPAGVDAPVFPVLFTEKEQSAAGAYLEKEGGVARYVGLHPGSSGEHGMSAKRWDPMRFGGLTDRICKELNAQALIFGGREEENIKHVAASMITAPFHIVESTDLRTTAALIARCSLFLCNDSGLMHIAACMKVPVAAVFGPTDEKRNGPFGTGHLAIRKPMDGFPLWTAVTVGVRAVKGEVDPQTSLKALTVDEAWEKVMPFVARLKDLFKVPAVDRTNRLSVSVRE
jgi:ADP-heptose:LPS heptosyltransferase